MNRLSRKMTRRQLLALRGTRGGPGGRCIDVRPALGRRPLPLVQDRRLRLVAGQATTRRRLTWPSRSAWTACRSTWARAGNDMRLRRPEVQKAYREAAQADRPGDRLAGDCAR